MANRIIASAEQLLDFPESGRQGDVPGTRELLTPQLPYVLIYRSSDQQIEILRVWHQRESRDGERA